MTQEIRTRPRKKTIVDLKYLGLVPEEPEKKSTSKEPEELPEIVFSEDLTSEMKNFYFLNELFLKDKFLNKYFRFRCSRKESLVVQLIEKRRFPFFFRKYSKIDVNLKDDDKEFPNSLANLHFILNELTNENKMKEYKLIHHAGGSILKAIYSSAYRDKYIDPVSGKLIHHRIRNSIKALDVTAFIISGSALLLAILL